MIVPVPLHRCSQKAIEAAIQGRQWSKAIQILELQEPSLSAGYFKLIADHYASAREYGLAEEYYLKADLAQEAVDMYLNADRYVAHLCCLSVKCQPLKCSVIW